MVGDAYEVEVLLDDVSTRGLSLWRLWCVAVGAKLLTLVYLITDPFVGSRAVQRRCEW